MLRSLFTLSFVFFLIVPAVAQQEYFFPGKGPFDENIPSPQEFLGYEIGDFHTRHDRIVAYFKELARVSEKVNVHEIVKTYEQRAMIVANINSSENYSTLENIRQEHLHLTNPEESLP